MNQSKHQVNKLFIGAILLIGLLLGCSGSHKEPIAHFVSKTDVDLTLNRVPDGPSKSATKDELYQFAWQQFVALNWPVADPKTPGNRGVPSSDATFLSITPSHNPTLVWHTYASKAEMFGPAYQDSLLPAWNTLSLPNYSYVHTAKNKDNSNYQLFNNLDENNEIGQAFVWGGAGLGNTTGGKQVLYEAKVNEVEYTYIRAYNLQNSEVAKTWSNFTKDSLNVFGGTCETYKAAENSIICFPCADSTSEGVIEIKAAWRELTSIDNTSHYYTKKVIVYENKMGSEYYTNKTYGLIGLHIIRKTANYPTFIFTTFNHVDNIKNGIYYQNEKSKQGKPQYRKGEIAFDTIPNTIEIGTIAVNTQEEIHIIPNSLKSFNTKIQMEIKKATSTSVWQYYELLGVQATPVDISNAASDKSYYLANDVIETDYTLRRFTGSFGKTGIELGTQNIHMQSITLSMGGCMGCHGNAQNSGTDFSFLLNAGVLQSPDTLGTQNEVLIIRNRDITQRIK